MALNCLHIVKRKRKRETNKTNENKKKKRKVKEKKDILLVIDRSGSMADLGPNTAAKGTAEFLQTQKTTAQTKNLDITMTFVTFDDVAERHFENKNICDVNIPFSEMAKMCKPRGMTRFIDTGVEELRRQKKRTLVSKATRHVAFLTDGHDNVSKDHSLVDFAAEIKDVENNNGTAIFLAANIDAMTTAKQYGFNPKQTMQFSARQQSARAAFRCASNSLTRGVSGANAAFTASERLSTQPDIRGILHDPVELSKRNYYPYTKPKWWPGQKK